MRIASSMMVMAALCLLAAPTIAMPWGNGHGVGSWQMDLTDEEMMNMTLAELKELKDQKMAEMENMTLSDLKQMREEQRAERENMTLADVQEQGRFKGDGRFDNQRFDGRQADGCQGDGRQAGPDGMHPFMGGDLCLLDLDISQEELDGMTLAEIQALREQKRAEMENMTLAEIQALREQKRAEMENMTLAELKESGKFCGMMGPGCPMGDGGMMGAGNQMGAGCQMEDRAQNGPGRMTDRFGNDGSPRGRA